MGSATAAPSTVRRKSPGWMPAAAAGEPSWMALIGPISMMTPSQRMGRESTRTETCWVLAFFGGAPFSAGSARWTVTRSGLSACSPR